MGVRGVYNVYKNLQGEWSTQENTLSATIHQLAITKSSQTKRIIYWLLLSGINIAYCLCSLGIIYIGVEGKRAQSGASRQRLQVNTSWGVILAPRFNSEPSHAHALRFNHMLLPEHHLLKHKTSSLLLSPFKK